VCLASETHLILKADPRPRTPSQVPWHALRGRLLSISLTDVYLCACPRPESDWEEGPAGDRARAAKRARLKAVEMERLSKPAGSGERPGSGAGFIL